MGIRDNSTPLVSAGNVVQPLNIGRPVYVRSDKLDQVAVILRCLIAIGDEGIDHLADEPYEVLVRKLNNYKININELAESAKLVVSCMKNQTDQQ